MMAGKILAEAALLEGMNVTWFPSYGAAVRGGPANCTVIVSDRPIGSPVVRKTETLIALNDVSLNRFENMLVTGGFLVMDSSNIKMRPRRGDLSIEAVPVKAIASDEAPSRLANIYLIGAYVGRKGLMKPQSVREAISRLSLADSEANLRAFELGKEFSSIDKKSQDI